MLVYLRNLPAKRGMAVRLQTTSGDRGEALFQSKGCGNCHVGDLNLRSRLQGKTLTDIAASMWNHAPMMRRRGGSLPRLASGEMQDVIAYLFLQQYFYEPGDAARGKRVYDSKGCAGCHEGKRAPGAPDLAATVQAYTPISMAGAVWRHGSGMRDALRAQGKEWPRFQDSEMTDLMTYLNSRLRTQIAR